MAKNHNRPLIRDFLSRLISDSFPKRIPNARVQSSMYLHIPCLPIWYSSQFSRVNDCSEARRVMQVVRWCLICLLSHCMDVIDFFKRHTSQDGDCIVANHITRCTDSGWVRFRWMQTQFIQMHNLHRNGIHSLCTVPHIHTQSVCNSMASERNIYSKRSRNGMPCFGNGMLQSSQFPCTPKESVPFSIQSRVSVFHSTIFTLHAPVAASNSNV